MTTTVKQLETMNQEKHMAAHEAAAEILKAAKTADKGFHYVLITTHSESQTATHSIHSPDNELVAMLAAGFSPQILHRALGIALQKPEQ